MRLRLPVIAVLSMIPCLLCPVSALAVSCTTQSQMTAAQRSLLQEAARKLGTQIQAGNSAGVRANTVAAVAAQFSGIEATIAQVSPLIQKATLTVDSLYSLNASDLAAGATEGQFFCAVPASPLLVTVTIPQLPQGNYALAVVHATGVEQPQQMSFILQNDPAGSQDWKLAGLFLRPLTLAGHNGVWYWTQARAFAQKQQKINAYFYYQTAQYLLNPVTFFSSPNLEKLEKEMQAIQPAELPGEQPFMVKVNGQDLAVTGMRVESFSGAFDLVVDYKTQSVADPVASRTQIVGLMKALLTRYPELKDGFHGLWVYAHAGDGQSFAIELPMNQIQ